ncbi:glycosyltransferase family 9 protein [Ralstonia pickettii]|uniref:glycosyltransferase family 9 protein n=1 Tax=Ralstonia pickettii TaxID=329 RepID=UPI00271490DF|nr:glycosyltransferase family 9 protein [Ralstonia pickettii]WKZ85306.1 glycosyltransferase family 9 protein [Ralstonia pickettii]
MQKKSVLLIRVGMLGDTIWGMSPIDSLIAHYGPDTKVDVVVKKGMAGLFAYDPRIGRVFEIAKRKVPFPFSPTKWRVLLHSLREPYELALDMETKSFFRGLFFLLRAKKKVMGCSIRDQVGAPTEHAVISIRKITELAIPGALARTASPKLIAPTSIDLQSLIPGNKPYVCLHFGNSWIAAGRKALRAWPAQQWRELLSNWKNDFPDHTPVIIGTASEAELAASITEGMDGHINLCGKTNLQQMMAVMAGSAALISTDTGPSHMAAALGVPVVSLFGPTQALQTGPFADGTNFVDIVSVKVSCSPCVGTPAFRTCERNRCMEAITPQKVAASTRALIQLRQDRSK